MSAADIKRRVAIIDEFGELSDKIARLTPTIQRHRLLRDEIESWHRDQPADQDYLVAGSRYEVQIGAREFRRVVSDMPRLFTILGKLKFLAMCSFPLKALDENTTAADQAKIVQKERIGPRSIKSIALDRKQSVEQVA